MSDEFDSINSRIPDINTALTQRIAARKTSTDPLPPPGCADPYQLMLQKKRAFDSNDMEPGKFLRWPEEDVKKLQDYCVKMGIVGYNSGKLHPLAALSLLKKQLGDDYTNVPLEERVPSGYQKMGSTGYSKQSPYSEVMRQKQILHG